MRLAWWPCLLLLWSAPALACVCFQSTLEADFQNSPTAFLGKVIRFVPVEKGSAVRVKVLESWKGPKPGTEVIVATPPSDGMCGVNFETDSSFVIFAWPRTQKRRWPWEEDRSAWLGTNMCAGSFAVGQNPVRLASIRSLTRQSSNLGARHPEKH